MTRHVLTLNAGSSSIKFAVYALSDDNTPAPRMSGQIESIGLTPRLVIDEASGAARTRELSGAETDGHAGACTALLNETKRSCPDVDILAVGHRVVHGGPDLAEPVILDDAIIAKLDAYSAFAPLHQPHNLAGVTGARAAFPDTPQIACFDTAFHRNHPWVNDVFALPRSFYDQGVRRYGFHGLSYEYVSNRLAILSPGIHDGRVVVAHLGNGASMCALLGGRSIGSTMGFTALDGLPMGTRCGQVDPGVVLYMMDQLGMSSKEITDVLYRKSGLLGLSGVSSDMRTLQTSDAPEAMEAIDYFVFRIRRELGALSAVLGGLDALVFTGGIGEHSDVIRARACEGQDWLGIELDRSANAQHKTVISTALSRTHVMVIPTNEELVIARATAKLLAPAPQTAKGSV